MKQLLDVPRLTLTFDIWTETMLAKSYLGVTIHYLKNTNFMSQCLAVPEP